MFISQCTNVPNTSQERRERWEEEERKERRREGGKEEMFSFDLNYLSEDKSSGFGGFKIHLKMKLPDRFAVPRLIHNCFGLSLWDGMHYQRVLRS